MHLVLHIDNEIIVFEMSICKHCGKEIEGRSDKQFCDQYCKSAYHYQKNKIETPPFYLRVQKQLHLNRKILKQYNKAGKSTVRVSKLHSDGFNPKFFTHYWKNHKGDAYLFVYEYGFRKISEHATAKYLLIQWQEYMEKDI